MLSKALELDSLSGDPALDIPRCHVPMGSSVHVLQKVCEGHRQSASCTIVVSLIDMLDVYLIQEELDQGLCVG